MLQEIGNSRKPNYNENDFLKFDIDSNLSFFFLNKRYMLISIASPPLKTLKSKYLVHKFNKITPPPTFLNVEFKPVIYKGKLTLIASLDMYANSYV